MDPIKHIAHSYKDVRLTSEEREVMRTRILARIRATEAAAPRIPSPYTGFFMTLTFQRATAFLLLVAATVGGAGGATLAAENAVPGDTMYAVKVHLTEPFSSLAAVTPSAKAAVAIAHTERRLKEAEVLAARGELDEEEAEDLSLRFAASAEKASTHIDTLTIADPEKATVASTELESVLSAHGRILDDIILARNGPSEGRLAMLRAEIAEREEATGRTREAFRLAMHAETERNTSARLFVDVAKDAEDAVRDLAKRSETLPANDVIALDTRVAVITEAVDEGRAKHELGEYKDALADFARARTMIGVGKRLLEAKEQFETHAETEVAMVPQEEVATELVVEPAADTAVTMTMMATESAPMAKNAATTSTSTATSTAEEPEVLRQETRFWRGENWPQRPIRINLAP